MLVQPIRNLELHVVHGCNLTCESCSHYSNQGHQGLLSLEEADHWMSLWGRRVQPQVFSLLGGEPTIHPRFPELSSESTDAQVSAFFHRQEEDVCGMCPANPQRFELPRPLR